VRYRTLELCPGADAPSNQLLILDVADLTRTPVNSADTRIGEKWPATQELSHTGLPLFPNQRPELGAVPAQHPGDRAVRREPLRLSAGPATLGFSMTVMPVTPAPEPGTLALLVAGFGALFGRRRLNSPPRPLARGGDKGTGNVVSFHRRLEASAARC